MFDYTSYNEEKYKEDYWTINRSEYKWFSNYVKLKLFKKWALDVKSKDVFLDVGGGVGNWAFHFLKYYNKVIVLDVSKEALKKIPEKEIVKIQGSAIHIPLKKESVDCILLADVFEHILPKDLDKLIKELRRVLKKDGTVIIFTMQYGYGITLMINRFLGRMKGQLMLDELNEGHLNRLKFDQMKDLIVRNNMYLEDYYHYSIIFQQSTDFLKDSIAKFIDTIRGKKATRSGQVVKDNLKKISKPGLIFKTIFGFLSFISYLDILLFGKLLPGQSIFLKLKKAL